MSKIGSTIIMFILFFCPFSLWGQTGQELKIISYNIWNGFEGDSIRRFHFIEWTTDQSADIVVLTELVNFKEKDLVTLGKACGYPHATIVKEEGYPVGVLSLQPIEVITKCVKGFWHGMLHVKTAGVDIIATHLSPFEWTYRMEEAHKIVDYIRKKELTDYIVAGDLNAHSPFDYEEIVKHDTLLLNMRRWDASQPKYKNLRDDNFDFSVISYFLGYGMQDAIGLKVNPAINRMSYPAAFLYGWKIEDKRLPLRRERLDYILLSPSLMKYCVNAVVYPIEGISDHYPISVTLIK